MGRLGSSPVGGTGWFAGLACIRTYRGPFSVFPKLRLTEGTAGTRFPSRTRISPLIFFACRSGSPPYRFAALLLSVAAIRI